MGGLVAHEGDGHGDVLLADVDAGVPGAADTPAAIWPRTQIADLVRLVQVGDVPPVGHIELRCDVVLCFGGTASDLCV